MISGRSDMTSEQKEAKAHTLGLLHNKSSRVIALPCEVTGDRWAIISRVYQSSTGQLSPPLSYFRTPFHRSRYGHPLCRHSHRHIETNREPTNKSQEYGWTLRAILNAVTRLIKYHGISAGNPFHKSRDALPCVHAYVVGISSLNLKLLHRRVWALALTKY